MAKLNNFSATLKVEDGFAPFPGNDYPLMEAHSVMVAEDDTRLDAKLNNYDERVGYLEKHLLGIEPEDPDAPDAPELPQLAEPFIYIVEDEDIVGTLTQLDKPEIYISIGGSTKPEDPDNPDTPDVPVEPTIPKLNTPEIDIYYDEDEKETTLESLSQPNIEIYYGEHEEEVTPSLNKPIVYIITGGIHNIAVNKIYTLPAEDSDKATRTFSLWVKIKAVGEDGIELYTEKISSYSTENITNQRYTIKISDMQTDSEGDCYFTYTVDGLFSRSVYADLPKHSICNIVDAEVLGVSACYEGDVDVPDTPVLEQLAKPEIDIVYNVE